jgi:predicted 2-oxoglutarate/Fe(II)-dependent dioxygenase YbiX
VFHKGKQVDGTVGGSHKVYQPEFKSRTDHMVEGALNHELDEKLARSVFPELKKAFGFDVTHRESYKIGRYNSEKGGFFKAHRDNFEALLGYRRVAMTINLNDDYEGGGVTFPEYGSDIYRPRAGGAVAFPCALLHEAKKVTAGDRYVLVCFFHGQTDEAYRRQVYLNQGKPLQIDQYTPMLRRFPGMAQSRDFYRKWEETSVHYSLSDVGTPQKGDVE